MRSDTVVLECIANRVLPLSRNTLGGLSSWSWWFRWREIECVDAEKLGGEVAKLGPVASQNLLSNGHAICYLPHHGSMILQICSIRP